MIDATPSLRAAEKTSLSALTSYLRDTGWTSRPSQVDGIAIYSKNVPGAENPVQFILPVRPGFVDEHRRVAGALRTVAVVEERSEESIAEDVRRYGDSTASRLGALAAAEESAVAKSTAGKFQIPREMRTLAEQSVEQARKAFDNFVRAAQKAAGQLEGQTSAAQASAKDMRQKAMTFAEKNVATSFEFAQKLVRAKDLEEVARLQTEFVKSQMQSLAEQAQKPDQTATRASKSNVLRSES